MTAKFKIGQILFNRNTGETGTVRSAYTSNGKITYELALPGERENPNVDNCSHWNEELLKVVDKHLPAQSVQPYYCLYSGLWDRHSHTKA